MLNPIPYHYVTPFHAEGKFSSESNIRCKKKKAILYWYSKLRIPEERRKKEK